MTDYSWVARMGGEGAPLLVCDADAYAAWGGAVLSPDYELDPGCDFSRANAVLHPEDDELEAALVRFGADDEHTGLLWEMDGPGAADVATGDDGFLIMRSWVRDSEAPRRFVTGPAARGRETPVADLVIGSGHLAVVWAPVGAAEFSPFEELRAGDSPVRLDLDHILGVGTLLRIRPGTYRATCGWHDGTRGRYAPSAETDHSGDADDDWSCRWIRFVDISG